MAVQIVLEGQARYLTAPSYTLGRAGDCDVLLPENDNLVSRHHARIERDGAGQWWLDDLKSTNGTFLNGEKLTARHALSHGDQVNIGRTQIAFVAPQAAAAPASATPARDTATAFVSPSDLQDKLQAMPAAAVAAAAVPAVPAPSAPAPVAATPMQPTPVAPAPVQAAPVQAAPVQAAPVQAAPVQAAPAPEMSMAEPAPTPPTASAQPATQEATATVFARPGSTLLIGPAASSSGAEPPAEDAPAPFAHDASLAMPPVRPTLEKAPQVLEASAPAPQASTSAPIASGGFGAFENSVPRATAAEPSAFAQEFGAAPFAPFAPDAPTAPIIPPASAPPVASGEALAAASQAASKQCTRCRNVYPFELNECPACGHGGFKMQAASPSTMLAASPATELIPVLGLGAEPQLPVAAASSPTVVSSPGVVQGAVERTPFDPPLSLDKTAASPPQSATVVSSAPMAPNVGPYPAPNAASSWNPHLDFGAQGQAPQGQAPQFGPQGPMPQGQMPPGYGQQFGATIPSAQGQQGPGMARAMVAPKKPILATLLNLIIPGAGQFYNGQIAKGTAFLVASLIWIVIYATILISPHSLPSIPRGGMFTALYNLLLIASMVDAYISAGRINAQAAQNPPR